MMSQRVEMDVDHAFDDDDTLSFLQLPSQAVISANIASVLKRIRSLPAASFSSSAAVDSLGTIDCDPYSSFLTTYQSTASTATLLPPESVALSTPAASKAIDWLASSFDHSSSLVAQALEILRSPSSDDDIAGSLLELYGYERIESVAKAVKRRRSIIQEDEPASSSRPSVAEVPATSTNGRSHHQQHHPPLHHQSTPQQQRVPQAQITFQTAGELAASKRAKKANHRSRNAAAAHAAAGGDEEEIDLDEWERIRIESLAAGPGHGLSEHRVSFFLFLAVF